MSALAGAALSAMGSLFGKGLDVINANNTAEKAFSRQKDLMALQQQYAVENWQRETNYNSPKEQMARLRAAGLNPNLVYGDGVDGMVSPAISSPTAPSAPMPAVGMPSFGSTAAEVAQIVSAMASAKKVGSETIAQNLENKYLSDTLQERINSIALQNKWTKEQTSKVSEETAVLNQSYANLVADANLKHLDAQEKRARLAKLEDFLDAELQSYKDKHNMSAFEYKQAQLMADDVRRKLKTEADFLELTYDIESNYKDTERRLGILGTVIGLAAKFFK